MAAASCIQLIFAEELLCLQGQFDQIIFSRILRQARRLRERLFPALNYLERLKSLMEKTFPPADPLFVAVMAAYTSRVDLSMKLHYLSCESGVGRARREKPDA